MICRNCEKDFDDNLNYCPYCGTPAKHTRNRSRRTSTSEDEGARRNAAPAVRKVRLNFPAQMEETVDVSERSAISKESGIAAMHSTVAAENGQDFRTSDKSNDKINTEAVAEAKEAEVTEKTKERNSVLHAVQEKAVADKAKATQTDANNEKIFLNKKTEEETKSLPSAGETDTLEEEESPKESLEESTNEFSKSPSEKKAEDASAESLNKENAVEPSTEKTTDRFKSTAAVIWTPVAVFFVALGGKISVWGKQAGSAIAKALRVSGQWLAVHAKKLGRALGATYKKVKEALGVRLESIKKNRAQKEEERKVQAAEAARIREIEEKERREADLRRLHQEAERTQGEFATLDDREDFHRSTFDSHRSKPEKNRFVAASEFLQESAVSDDTMPWRDSDRRALEDELDRRALEEELDRRAGIYSDPQEADDQPNFLSRRDESAYPKNSFEEFHSLENERDKQTSISSDVRNRYLDDFDMKKADAYEPQSEEKTTLFQDIYEWFAIRLRARHIAIIVLVLLLVAGVFFISTLGSPIKKFTEALKNRDYDAAAELYTSRYAGKDELEMQSKQEFSIFLEDLKKNAVDEKSTFSATAAALNVIKDSKLYTGPYKEMVDKAIDNLTVLQEAAAIYKSGQEKQDVADHKGAIADFNRVMELAPNFRDVANLLARSRDRLRESVVQTVNTLQSQKNFADAAGLIEETLKLIPNDPVLTNLKESNAAQSVSVLYEETLTEAERYFQAGDLKNVFATINKVIKEHPEDKSIVELRNDYVAKTAESFLRISDDLFLNGDKEGALKKIDEGLELLPDNQVLLDAKSRYELGETPVSQQDNTKYTVKEDQQTGDGDSAVGELPRQAAKDVGGNQYSNAYLHSINWNGDQNAIDQVTLSNPKGLGTLSGTFSLGEMDKYTQVYIQIYSTTTSGPAVFSGVIYAYPDDAGDKYRMSVNVPTNGDTGYVVTLNYIYGSKINVIVDLEFS